LPPSRKNKIGRNDACHCGSGRKFKRCHGSGRMDFHVSSSPPLEADLTQLIQQAEARELQRQQQQGLGRPIASTVFRAYRLVLVRGRVHYSKTWKTFHDFLMYYIKIMLGEDWGTSELKKPEAERHPILQWYGILCKFQREHAPKVPGAVRTAAMTGDAVEAYLGLAYNLYLLAQNAELQDRMINRLKHRFNFLGAYYETYVAAAFIKAGFDIAFEDETDPSHSHCEFVATYRATGRHFSVEAKARQPGKASAKVHRQLHDALAKEAAHPRIVFIDVNVPDVPSEAQSVAWLEEALANIHDKETTMVVAGAPAPAAYVFLTNHTHQYNLESSQFRHAVVSEGFKIPDFRLDASFPSVRHALAARERHREMYALMASIRNHYDIPATFDGEIPEFAFGDGTPPLRIGHKYLVPDTDGNEIVGVLTDATVLESERAAYGTYKLADGRSIIVATPLTADEIVAYRRHPDTFFGIVTQQVKRLDDPLELFDFLYAIYRLSSREKLLEFMASWPDVEALKAMDTNELAITYCERLVYATLAESGTNRTNADV
jgi:hypothetical protein